MKGFDDKLLNLFEVVLQRLLSFRGRIPEDGLPDNIDDARFDACIEMIRRGYNNEGMSAANLAGLVRVRSICPGTWSAKQKVSKLLGRLKFFGGSVASGLTCVCLSSSWTQ